MIWTRQTAKKFLSEHSENMPSEIKSATEFILSELEMLENAQSKNENPRVEIIDETHQKFNGEIYRKNKRNGYYYLTKSLHIEVYKFYSGIEEIPKECLVHHATKNEIGSYDKDKNNIEDLKLMTREEHTSLHNPELGVMQTFVCRNCGKEYQSRYNGKNCYCSVKCKNEWKSKSKLDEKNRIIRHCEWCGKEFSDWRYGHKRFCSSSCAHFSHWKKIKEKRVLTNEEVKCIREIYKPFDKEFGQQKLADIFGVTVGVIGKIVRGEIYTDIESTDDK